MIDRRTLLRLMPALAATPAVGIATQPLSARETQEIVTPQGLRLWLVEERAAPLVAIWFGMPGGSTQDPAGKEGLTSFLVAMLEEGAGQLDARGFKDQLKATATEMSFSVARDRITGGILALERSLLASADLLALAITRPRFDPDAVERIRSRLINRLQHEASDASRLALDAWYGEAFAGHPYGRSPSGTAGTLSAIGRDDLIAHHRRLLARAGLGVVMVGSIGEKDAAALADRLFGGLPADRNIQSIPARDPIAAARRRVIMREQGLSSAVFGLAGRSTMHADHAPALVLNHIMGSGDFDARLVEEVRVKRGLTYSVRTSLVSDTTIAIMLGQLATRNEAMGEALDVIEAQFERMARQGPTDDEVANAKSYLSGSLLLGFDGSARLADGLLGVWLDGHGRDALLQRRRRIEGVAASDVARLATQMLRTDRLVTVVVGNPNLTSR